LYLPVKRLGLRIAMVLVAVNVWTGSPLTALWIGSRLQGGGPPKMGPVFVVILMIGLFSFALAWLLAQLGGVHDRMTGQVAQVHRHVAWLRSMRGERPQYPGEPTQVTALERVLIVVVVAACLAFEIWFFFFSSSPIDQRSGRGAVPLASRPLPVRAPAAPLAAGSATRSPALRGARRGPSRSGR
jgi:hypothetical protein